jgi:transglutaminase-like putative cysteine protease
MRLAIQHRTTYRYETPSDHLVQLLRLTPREGSTQRVERWSVRDASNRTLIPTHDAFDNFAHLHTIGDRHDAVEIEVEGVVETRETQGVVGVLRETLPPEAFLRSTALTRPTPELAQLAEAVGSRGGALEQLHALLLCVHERVAYRPGETDVATPAGEVLRAGRGVCQDHAHVFAAASRLLGHPARYVSGYFRPEPSSGDSGLATHAWAEAWVGHLGWVGFDASQGLCPTECYVRVAVGRDYQDAAPMRGVRRGSGEQRVEVRLELRAIGEQ